MKYDKIILTIKFDGYTAMSRCSICGGTWEMCGCGAR